ncbi:amidase family protein [Embleya sp. NPDC001921]
MRLGEYAKYDAIGLRDLIRAGEVTSAEVEGAARQALGVADAAVHGLALPAFEPALERSPDPDAAFAGVPFLIKDTGPVAAGVPFFLGSRAVPGVVPAHDSDLMTRFRAAGLVTLGLTTAPEMAISFATESAKYGVTRNPWDLDRGVGGSSGGPAALVAAGAVPIAHATDGPEHLGPTDRRATGGPLRPRGHPLPPRHPPRTSPPLAPPHTPHLRHRIAPNSSSGYGGGNTIRSARSNSARAR